MPSTKEINKIRKRVESSNISDMKKLFAALSDETRLKALAIFLEKTPKHLCVSDVAEILEITVPAASYQLSKLEDAGFLNKTKDGKMVCYKMNEDNEVAEILKGRLS